MSLDPDQDLSIRKDLKTRTEDVLIGGYRWVGVNVYIGPDAAIGENSVIGAKGVYMKYPASLYSCRQSS